MGKTIAIGGTMRWLMIQIARLSPPVLKRARL